jgi:hypothetical protein
MSAFTVVPSSASVPIVMASAVPSIPVTTNVAATITNSINDINTVIVGYSPVLITFLIVFLSAFSQTWQGCFFFASLFLFCFIRSLLIRNLSTQPSNISTPNCVDYIFPFTGYKNDGFNIFYITFLFGYIISPMLLKMVPVNIALIVILGVYTVWVWIIGIRSSCVSSGYLIGNIVYGIISVSITISIILSFKLESYLFLYDSVSDSIKCSMPSKQSFKCNVYKNGELISSNTT